MEPSKELADLMQKMRDDEANLPPCERCGQRLRFYHNQPGVECRPCGRVWLYSFSSGKSIECAWTEQTTDGGIKYSMLLPVNGEEKPQGL